MAQQPKRSEMWWRGHNDALAGDPPNESYYHYYYDYKLAYDQVRRDQRRNRQQRVLAHVGRRMLLIGPVLVLVVALGWGAWTQLRPPTADEIAAAAPTRTPRPTPRPTYTPSPPTATPEGLYISGLAIVSGTDGASLYMRREPSRQAEQVGKLREGQRVRLLEGPTDGDGLQWWRVEAESITGWAAASYLTPAGTSAQ